MWYKIIGFTASFLIGGFIGFYLGLGGLILPPETVEIGPPSESMISAHFLKTSENLGLLDNVWVQLRGKIVSIDDRELVLHQPDNNNKSLAVIIDPEMEVLAGRITRVRTGDQVIDGEVEEIVLNKVKVGDKVTVNCMLTAEDCKLGGILVEEGDIE